LIGISALRIPKALKETPNAIKANAATMSKIGTNFPFRIIVEY
jgi:hypothetical protein